MANAREIKSRMKSVQDTQKITTAMYMISSNRLRKARRELDATRPYFDSLINVVTQLIHHAPEAESLYFGKADYNDDGIWRRGYLVITADKGLAGAYNSNVLKLVKSELDIHDGEDMELYVVGEVGRQFFQQHGYAIQQNFQYTAQNPTIDRARSIAYTLFQRFASKELDEIYIAYTDMENTISSTPRFYRLLPMEKRRLQDAQTEVRENGGFGESCEFQPSLVELLSDMVPAILTGYIYSALVDSYCAEQNARMMAMDAANRNAEEMLHELSIRYNRTRQAAITQEITEVASGAKAQRRNT